MTFCRPDAVQPKPRRWLLLRAFSEFPDAEKAARPLSTAELERLKGRAGPWGGNISGELYNGGTVSVNRVQITVVTLDDGGSTKTRPYWLDVTIRPSQTASVLFKYIQGEDGKLESWRITAGEASVE